MARVIPVVLSIALTVFALSDCIQTTDQHVRGIPKWAWILLIVLVPWVGPITWLLIGKDRGLGAGGADGRSRGRTGPLAPDEDPEFLRELDEQIQRERRERMRREREERGRDESERDE